MQNAFGVNKVKVVGFEAANSYVKSRSAKGKITYLNALKERFDHEEIVQIKNKVGVQADDRPEDKLFKFEGKMYTVGDALDANFSTARDADRYSSPFYRIASILAVAQHAENGDKILAVTGVPANHYRNETVYKDIKDALIGVHTVVINGEVRTFEIVDVKIILQPMGTMYSLIINEDGTYTEHGQDLEEARQKVIIDIGFGSTDVAILDGMTLKNSFAIDHSMVDAYIRIQQKLGLTNKKEPLEIEQDLKRSVIIRHGGISYDATEAKAEAFEITAQTIIAKVKNRVKLEDFDYVIFTGGGVEALYQPLKGHLVGVPNAVKVGDAQGANAEGYYLFGIFAS